MYMDSRVWLALSQGAKEQYRRWFGNIETRPADAPMPLGHKKAEPRPAREKR